MAKFSESARERELFRYEASVIAGTVPSTLGIDPIASLAQEAPFQQNPILTALAQLCAARLSAACVYISFFETQSQHVVACASPTSSLFHAGPDTDLLDLCGKAFPRNTSISEHVLQLEDIPVDDAVTQECQGQHLPISYIPDLAYHSRYSQHFFVIGKNRMRRYAAIPIKSPRGANIGVISTYSQEPGPENGDLSENASKALREASCAITEHMELVRASDGLRRTDRMVRGLGSFVEGYAGMAFSKDTNSGSSFDNVPGEGALNSRQQFLQRRATNEDETSRAFWDKMKGPTSPSQTSYFSQRPHVVSTAGSPPLSTPSVPQYMPSVTGPSTGSIITVSSETSDEDPFFAAKMIFSKAANVIRESLEVEGVLFLDASISSFGGLVSTDGRIHASRYATDMPRYSSSSDSSTDSLDERRKHEAPKLCNVFGFSTSDNSSIDCDSASPMHTAVPEKLLSALLRRHPRGKIFNFGADGSLSSGESEEEKFRNTDVEDFAPGIEGQPAGPDGSARRRASARPWSKHNEGKSVLKILSGARSVMFIPLWDANKERWYAGALVWTRSPSRFFTREGELSYLQAFNTTIMSEIMKSDALIADKAKADVLGSMSHELRSPLHGVLAAVDLFRDETVTASQADLLHSLESCGRTLLDVVNHLLDYSKVNTYLKESRDSRGDNKSIRSGSSPHPTGPHTPSRTTELDVLVEESVNSSFAGHAFQMLSIAQTSSHIHVDDADVVALRKLDTMEAMESFGHQGKSAIHHAARLGKVTVLLHIDPTVQWTFSTQSGAIRRIVLNVFGNALKYTEEGFISVALFQETAHTKNSQQAVTRLKLSVVDSGRGISPQFLQQKLFTPFAQEDRLAPGTGLGMSLVKQIVRTMSGSLTVESQVGIGTSVRISIPMKSATSAVDADANFIQQKEALRGLRISLAGLSRPIELNSKRQAMAGFTPPLPSDMMNTICAGWLQMQMVDLDDPNTRPDLILCGEDGLHEITRKGNLSALLTPTVVICADAVTAHRRSISPEYKMSGCVVEFISQPIGPRKLAKALEAALKRWIEVANSESSQSEPANRVPQTPSSTDLPLKAAQRAESGEAARQAASQGSQQQGNAAMSLSKLKENEDDEMVDQQPAEHEANKPSMEIAVVDGVNNHEKDAMDIAVLHEESEATEPPFLSANHFLLVDDNKINLQILVSFMQKLKLPYQTASHGLEAYERYIQAPGKFRCILMDLSMPIMDGLEACRRIREFERDYQLPSTKIVALTGLASVETQREAFASGMDLFYTKPVKLKDLSSAISEKRL